jgi:hypothetical protein
VLQVTIERSQGRKPLVTRFGGIPLTRQRTAVLTGRRSVMASTRRNELIHRLLAGRCEICETQVNLGVHRIRKLADLNKPGRRAGHRRARQRSLESGVHSAGGPGKRTGSNTGTAPRADSNIGTLLATSGWNLNRDRRAIPASCVTRDTLTQAG